ncbi:minor capsid protein, partial [Arthrobacter sp. NPDC057388]
MDFLDRMKQYIESNMLLFKKTLTVGPLTSGNDISILAIPSVKPTKNLDMSRNYIFAFQILVRHLDQYKSYTTCQQISDKLDTLTNGAVTSGGGSFTFVKCEVYTTPNWVEQTPEGHIYTAMFQA